MVKTWEDLDFDYLKEKCSGERIGCALKIETASRNKWWKCKMPFLSGYDVSYDFASPLFIRRGCNLKLQLANVHCLTARFL